MSIEGAVVDRKALAELASEMLDRWVHLEDRLGGRTMLTPPVAKGTYDEWCARLDRHAPSEFGGAS